MRIYFKGCDSDLQNCASRPIVKDFFKQYPLFGQRLPDVLASLARPINEIRPTTPTLTPTLTPTPKKKSTLAHRGDERMNGFDAFWKEYPRKKSKGPAEKAWKRWRGEGVSRETILQALNAQKSELVDRPSDKIPYPATWLNAKSWENEPDSDPDAIREGPNWDKAR